jgi:hypothetical protein
VHIGTHIEVTSQLGLSVSTLNFLEKVGQKNNQEREVAEDKTTFLDAVKALEATRK